MYRLSPAVKSIGSGIVLAVALLGVQCAVAANMNIPKKRVPIAWMTRIATIDGITTLSPLRRQSPVMSSLSARAMLLTMA